MAIEQFKSAQLADDVQQEFDSLSPKSIRLWRQIQNPVDGNDWEHIVSSSPTIQEQEGLHYVPVSISKWKTKIPDSILGSLGKLFRSRSEYQPAISKVPNGPQVEEALVKRRRALMVWAKEAGVPLDEKAMLALVPSVEDVEQLGPNVRLMNVKAEVMDRQSKILSHSVRPLNTPLVVQMNKLCTEIKESIKPFGKVVGEVNSFGERICICFKHVHGISSSLDELVRNPSEAEIFLNHQFEIYSLIKIINSIAGQENISFFMEGESANFDENKKDIFISKVAYKYFKGLFPMFGNLDSPNAEATKTFFKEISDKDKLGKVPSFRDVVKLLSGAQRFFQENGDNNILFAAQRVGLENMNIDPEIVAKSFIEKYPNWEELPYDQLKKLNDENMLFWLSKRMLSMHPHAVAAVHKNLMPGKTGLLILGGLHFDCGKKPFNDFSLPKETKLDKFFKSSKELKNCQILIVEPHSYEKYVLRE